MDARLRQPEHDDRPFRDATDRREWGDNDELARRRDRNRQEQRPALTRREREERWPIG